MQNRFSLAVMTCLAALAAMIPDTAAAREAEEISCPQTLTSPEAQVLLDAGKKPVAWKSWYKPGLVNSQGFCHVVVSNDGKTVFKVYNEATTVQQIPVRFAFNPDGFDVYAGPKGLPFGTGTPDMTCWAPEDGQSAVDCQMALADKSGFTVRVKEGRGIATESILRIDPREMFGTDLKEQSRFVHFQINFGFLDTAALMSMFTPAGNTFDPLPVDCTKDIWKNTVTKVAISTGPAKDIATAPVYTTNIVGEDVSLLQTDADEIPPVVARFSLDLAGGSSAVVGQIMSNEAVRFDVTTACEGTQSKVYATEMIRLMGYIYNAVKPGMLKQL